VHAPPLQLQRQIMNKTNILAVLTAVAALTVSGCANNNKEVSFKSGGMTHTFAEGQGSVPKDFPLPIYPQASTTGSVSAQADQASDESKFLILSSDDPYDKVGAYYKKELASAGWTIETVQTLPKLINIAATKNPYDANVMLSNDGAKTTISLAVSRTAGAEIPTPSAEQYVPDQLTPPTD
jgi:hypothetical protein